MWKLAAVWLGIAVISAAVWPSPGLAIDHFLVQRDEKQLTVSGEIVVEAKDRSVMVRSADGALWLLPADEILKRASDDQPFVPLTHDELGAKLLEEMGAGFEIHTTAHYVVCYNTSRAYAQWCGGLYERLLRAFMTYWKKRGLEVHDPKFPLVALVFDSKEAFRQYAQQEVGAEAAKSMIGYYNLETNRVTMYDLTGVDGAVNPRTATFARVQQILARPQAERTVATIVHEATHQLAYNTGVQQRLADNPFWVSEGLAMYFETPDLKSRNGWRSIGGINLVNFQQFRLYAAERPADSLVTLIADDRRFQDGRQVTNAYAESWALNYFLIRARRKQYADYMSQLAQKKPLLELTPQQRVAEFQEAFGDLRELDREFIKYMSRVR